MNVYLCCWYYSGRGHYYEELYCIVIAETEAVALGLALEKYPDTDKRDWGIVKIDSIKRDVIHVCYKEAY